MIKTAINICLTFCIFGVFVSCMLHHPVARAFGILASVAGIAVLYVADRRREKRQAFETHRINEQRTRELMRRYGAGPVILQVYCPSGTFPGLLVFVMGVMVLWKLPHDAVPVLFGAASLITGALSILTGVKKIGQPALELCNNGFSTPGYGFLPWFEVDGISLIELSYRRITSNHVLVFHVPRLAHYLNQFGAFQSFFFLFSRKRQVGVVLRKASEHPDVIRDLSRELLKRATGRDFPWSAVLSEKENEAYGRIHESLKSTGHFMREVASAHESRDYQSLEKLLESTKDKQKQLDQDLKEVQRAGHERHRKELFVMIAMAAWLVWLLWKEFLAK